ncbi:amine oxidase [Tuber magnatum]|uniref:Amine oxidase n=1 Tax=Tuber magnatum TaxID=42249 RepID=A0A317SPD8_9PEZI|nr:amine oxidase [Tuber magnatum]
MLLDKYNVPYEIIEASDRYGGRVYTHHFETPEKPDFHSYYDVGAMRFPRIKSMDSVFKLFSELGLDSEGGIIKYIMDAPGNIRLFNALVPDKYLKFTYTRPGSTPLKGVEALLADAYDPFKKKLVENFKEGWKYLMQFDNHSPPTYLSQVKGHPFSVIQWMETMDASTLSYDLAFSETIIDSIDFDYPHGPNHSRETVTEWFCVDGGTCVVTDRMAKKIRTNILYNRRVTAIAMDDPTSDDPAMKISVQGHPEYERKRYSHVISTAPLSCMRAMDLGQAGLDYAQNQALRGLGYGAAIKVGIKFKTRWWEKASGPAILGGVSSTDRPSRIVVYPSYGFKDPQDANGVLIASYCWTQDALRLGSLIKGKGTDAEKTLLIIIYKDLAELHGKDPQWYKDQTLDYHAYDWYHDQYSMGAVAYASFGPGQFSNLYPELSKPAAKGNLHFVGEATSTNHAWIVGALDSVHRAINEVFVKEQESDLIEKHAEDWEEGEVEQGYMAKLQCLRGILGV